MPWITYSASDIGARAEQQDRLLVLEHQKGDQQILVVADGAGGHAGGAKAAQVTIDCVREHQELLWSSKDLDADIRSVINRCNDRVLEIGGNELAASTIVLAVLRGDEIFWAHVGDSRFYLLRNGGVSVVTRDHSLRELEIGAESEQLINSEPIANQLYECLGSSESVMPQVDSCLANDGDVLALCSDGFWGQIDVLEALGTQVPSQTFVDEWVASAHSTGGDKSDNITLITAHYPSPKLSFGALLSNRLRTLFAR